MHFRKKDKKKFNTFYFKHTIYSQYNNLKNSKGDNIN